MSTSPEDFQFGELEHEFRLPEIDSLAGIVEFALQAKRTAEFAAIEVSLHQLFLKITSKIAEDAAPEVKHSVPRWLIPPVKGYDGVNQSKTWRPIVCDPLPSEAIKLPIIVLQEYSSTAEDINSPIIRYTPTLSVFDGHEKWNAYQRNPEAIPSLYFDRRVVGVMNGLNQSDVSDDDTFTHAMSDQSAYEYTCRSQAEYGEWLLRAASAIGIQSS